MATRRRQGGGGGPSGSPVRPANSPALERRRRRRWGYAVLASLLGHAVGIPLGLPRLLMAPPSEIEVAYLPDVDPAADPAAEVPPDPPSVTEPTPPKIEELEKRLAEKLAEKKPEEKKKPPKPLEVVKLPDLPMVDQEQFPEEQDNEKARFLAQKNHRAAEDMQAKERSLFKPPPADSPAAPAGDPNPPPPAATPEAKRAELLPPPLLPTMTPVPARPVAGSAAQSPLSMRGPQEDLQLPMVGGELVPVLPGQSKAVGKEAPLSMTPSRLGPLDYDRLVGAGVAEAERRSAALAEHGSAPGHWDKLMRKQDALRASLENFVGNVKTGNQSELGTRKHPFAAFITQMHRQIHRFWGDGFLRDIDSKSRDIYPMSLLTGLEISVRSDGSIDGIIIVKHSGSLPFDAAAMDAVMSAAPFPAPPEAIKSRDGQVYLTWSFHRDDRQCHPNYVDMHILTTPPKSKPTPATKPGPLLARPQPELARPPLPTAGSGRLAAAGSEAPVGGAAAPAKPSLFAPSPAPPTSAKSSSPATAVPDAARESTERWLAALQKGDVGWLAGASGLPFTAGGKQVADDGASLRAFYQEMLAEGMPRRERVTYYTPAQLLAKRGKLPRGADEDDMVFAWIEQAGEDLLLLLSPTDRGFSVVGIDR